MPEGHVLHRAARLQSKRFARRVVRASSPQGRFAEGAAIVDGQRIDSIHAYGKHLFYDLDGGLSIHVHLGLFGKFRIARLPAREPSPNCRLLLETDTDQLHLAGPTSCELLDPDGVAAVLARLGPDPIVARPGDLDRLAASLRRRRTPIGQVLLDQKVIAGIGNVYRSELLFLTGLHPFRPANELDAGDLAALWDATVVELCAGERLGRIVTVGPPDGPNTDADRRSLRAGERLYAYKRGGAPCRQCGGPIASAPIDARSIWWCPVCQPE